MAPEMRWRADRTGPTVAVVMPPLSYLLCGTPRTGSTLLCDLLASTGVAGRPESYFREPDEPAWAQRFGLALVGDGAFDHRSYVHAVRRAGSTPNGVFAARVMWGSMPRIVEKLDTGPGARCDLDLLADAFGQLRLVHVKRADVVGQAVSWARAEQTGYWQEGDRTSAHPRIDADHADRLVRTITEHNAAWSRWFQRQGVEPYVVMYEDVVADPGHAVQGLLDSLGVELPSTWRPRSAHRRQADELNAEWVDVLTQQARPAKRRDQA
jgi:LPS sulfotransferase NodH